MLDAIEAARDFICGILDSADVTLPAKLREAVGVIHDHLSGLLGDDDEDDKQDDDG